VLVVLALLLVRVFGKGVDMAEVVERRTGGMPVTPALGLLKKGGKDEEELRGKPCFESLSPSFV
jgi:hypothetical protein